MNKEISIGDTFILSCGNTAKVSAVFAKGFNYHTLNDENDCIAKEKYMLKIVWYKEYS